MGVQADQVRNDIISRVKSRLLLPGDRIDEDELRGRLGLSGTPIREAILTLEAVGIVERRPRSGPRIASLDLEGMVKLVEVLAEVEGAVAYRAARRIAPAESESLRQALEACEAWVAGKAPAGTQYYDLNLAFHTVLTVAAGNEFLAETMFGVGHRLIAYLNARHQLPGESIRSAREHRAIFEAVTTANGDRARQLMIAHVTMSDTLTLDVMNAVNRSRE